MGMGMRAEEVFHAKRDVGKVSPMIPMMLYFLSSLLILILILIYFFYFFRHRTYLTASESSRDCEHTRSRRVLIVVLGLILRIPLFPASLLPFFFLGSVHETMRVYSDGLWMRLRYYHYCIRYQTSESLLLLFLLLLLLLSLSLFFFLDEYSI